MHISDCDGCRTEGAKLQIAKLERLASADVSVIGGRGVRL